VLTSSSDELTHQEDTLRPTEAHLGEVRIIEDAEMAVRDQTILRGDVYLPAKAGAYPALLLRTPYNRRDAHGGSYRHAGWYARCGFAVMHQDCRGRFGSDGLFEPFVHEGKDGADAIEWIANQSWCNGQVFMYGASYSGLLQLQAAAERPPHLAGIAPGITSPWLRDEWLTRQGAFHLGFLPWWAASLGVNERWRSGDRDAAFKLRALMRQSGWLSERAPAEFATTLETPVYDQLMSYLDGPPPFDPIECLEQVDVPALHIGGFYDVFVRGTIGAFTRLRSRAAPQRLLLGPWQHYPWAARVGIARLPRECAGSQLIDQEQVRFFTALCNGELPDTGVAYYALLQDTWHESPSWPPPSMSMTLFLQSEGAANSLAGDGSLSTTVPDRDGDGDFFSISPDIPIWAQGGQSCCDEAFSGMGMADQGSLEERVDVLVYSTSPIEKPLHLAGDVSVRLFVSSDAPETRLSARLNVEIDGRSVNLVEGVADVTAPDTQTVPVEIDCGPMAAGIPIGAILRLVISGPLLPNHSMHPQRAGLRDVDSDGFDGRGATVLVHHDSQRPSLVELPLRPGSREE
jgi:putative CocE/NonD family hydrolase